jgi:hypothetical protein
MMMSAVVHAKARAKAQRTIFTPPLNSVKSVNLPHFLQPRRAGWIEIRKSILFCHSERSEESLFGLNARKERFLGEERASE